MIPCLICSKDWKFDSEWLINGFSTEASAYRGKYNSIHILYREAKNSAWNVQHTQPMITNDDNHNNRYAESDGTNDDDKSKAVKSPKQLTENYHCI